MPAPFASKIRGILTLKRALLITAGIIIAALSWVDYLLIYYFEDAFHACIHFFFRDFYTTHIIQEFFQGIAPILIFLVASISGGIIDGLVITGLSSLVFTFGKQTQLRVLILSLSYQPRLGWEYGIILTFMAAGFVGCFFSQFNVYSVIWRSIKSGFRMPKVLFPSVLFAALPVIIGKYANIWYISSSRMVFFNWSVTTNEIIVAAFIYSLLSSSLPSFFSKRFWCGAAIGGIISLSSFVGLLGSGTERILHDLIWLPYYIVVEGGIKSSYLAATVMAALFIFVSSLWGGFWGSAGKISSYVSPPIEVTKPHMKAYIFRDLWSNFFLHGKNRVNEFESKTKSKFALMKLSLKTGEYVTYERMDRVSRDEKPPMPEPELEIIPLDGNKCMLRVIKTGDMLGPFVNPDYLEPKYEPVWNPLALKYRAAVVKAFLPVIIGVAFLASIFFFLSIIPWVSIMLNPFRPLLMTGQTWLLVATSFLFLAALVSFVAYWARKSLPALSVRPESAPAIFMIGILSSGLFVFLEYFIVRLAEFLNINIVASPYTLLLGVPLERWFNNWLSIFEYNTQLILFEYNRVFSACYYGAVFLMIAALLIGLSEVQVMGLERYNLYFYASSGPLFPYKNRHDAPVWLEGNYYWVMRYIYWWPGEFTISSKALYATDYERVELWVNAETGELEWVVSDYHWRELFYRVPADRKEHCVVVDFNMNFHTPEITLVHPEELSSYSVPEAAKDLLMESVKKFVKRINEFLLSIRIRLFPEEEIKKIKKTFRKRVNFVEKYFTDIAPGARRLCAHVAASLPWSFWRYPFGVHSIKKEGGKYLYREKGYIPPVVKSPLHHVRVRIDGEGYPAVEPQHLCPSCSALIQIKYDSKEAADWTCPSCKVDVRRFSVFR